MSVEMYNIQIDSTISRILSVFYGLGMWRNEEETIFRKTGRRLLYLSTMSFFVISLISGAFVCEDMYESIFLANIAIDVVVITVRLAYILCKKKEINDFLGDICIHSLSDRENFTQIKMKLNNFMKFVNFFISIAIVSFIILMLTPALLSEKSLPYNIGFPLDWKNSEIAFWVAYSFVFVAMFVCVVATLLTVIIWYLMLNCSIKDEILGNQFRNMGAVITKNAATKTKKMSEVEKQKFFHQEFIDLIKTHQNIQETIEGFRAFFANIFFAQITTSGITICSSVYVLAFSANTSLFQFAYYGTVLIYNIFDIFMVMYFGNEIKLSSNRLSYCLFESNWTEQSKACKKCIIILTEMLQQPQELVIGILYPLNLETFTAILNLAYSMFNILQNFR